MDLDSFIMQHRIDILKRWFDSLVDSYPAETARMLRKESNQFSNPVGHTTYHAMEGLVTAFVDAADSESVRANLDRIIRIRAVQDFSPSQAVAFVFLLKRVVREELGSWKDQTVSESDLRAFEQRVDEMALLAFNIYMECREKLYEVRVEEFKNRTYRLLQRADLLADLSEQEPKGDNS